MVNLLKIDTHEPSLLDTLLKQVLGDVIVRTGLNDHGYADFTFNWWSGLLEEIERKQTNEILSSLEDVEYQIGEQIFRYPDSRRVLLIEGMQPTPTPMGIQTWKPGRNSKYYSMDREFKFPYQKYERWKADLERKGVLVWNTANLYGTAQALIALYRSAQEGSSILERYLRVKGIVQPKPDKVKANEEKIEKSSNDCAILNIVDITIIFTKIIPTKIKRRIMIYLPYTRFL